MKIVIKAFTAIGLLFGLATFNAYIRHPNAPERPSPLCVTGPLMIQGADFDPI